MGRGVIGPPRYFNDDFDPAEFMLYVVWAPIQLSMATTIIRHFVYPYPSQVPDYVKTLPVQSAGVQGLYPRLDIYVYVQICLYAYVISYVYVFKLQGSLTFFKAHLSMFQ